MAFGKSKLIDHILIVLITIFTVIGGIGWFLYQFYIVHTNVVLWLWIGSLLLSVIGVIIFIIRQHIEKKKDEKWKQEHEGPMKYFKE